jgi:hypothetical protein
MKPTFAVLAAALLSAATLLGEAALAAPIVPDRPSLSTGPEALEAGIFQLELGSRFAGGQLASAGFEGLQRFGLVPGLELRVSSPLAVSGTSAFSSVSLGAKAQFLEGYLLSLGALGAVELSPLGPSTTQASMLATLGLPAGYGLTVNVGPSWSGASLDWIGSALLAYDSGDLWQAFAEVGRFQDPAGSALGWGADAGLQVLVSEDVSWDVAVLKGLSPEVPDWAFTSGFSVRWGSR